MKTKFRNKVLQIGYGGVGQCVVPFLFEHLIGPEQLEVMDFEDKRKQIKPLTDMGVKYFRERITKRNLDGLLSKHLKAGDFLLDLGWNIGANDIIGWCHDHRVFYLNTSVEVWDSAGEVFTKDPYEKSLHYRQMNLRDMVAVWGKGQATTAIVDMGANPGLISSFARQGLLDIAGKALDTGAYAGVLDGRDSVEEKIRYYAERKDFANLSRVLGVKVIHCSERDTQISNDPKKVDEFCGTWSNEGLREEGTAPAEIGFGTHERELPEGAVLPSRGPKNQIMLHQMGINTLVRSYVPGYEIIGMVIRHGEAFGISDRLTVNDSLGRPVYRPTVHYAYMPCDATIASLQELRARGYEIQPKSRIMTDEIVSGKDILGALIMGHKFNSWWTGSILDIDEARRLVPHQNATTIQVAAGVVSGVKWAIENPRKGLCLPDDIPYDFVMNVSKPYLGKFVSKDYDWTPLKNRKVYFEGNPRNRPDLTDPFQFRNFLMPI